MDLRVLVTAWALAGVVMVPSGSSHHMEGHAEGDVNGIIEDILETKTPCPTLWTVALYEELAPIPGMPQGWKWSDEYQAYGVFTQVDTTTDSDGNTLYWYYINAGFSLDYEECRLGDLLECEHLHVHSDVVGDPAQACRQPLP